jgi:hypothetical protein
MGRIQGPGEVREKSAPANRPIKLAGSILGPRAHICAFFRNPDDEYQVLLPFVRDGLDRGEKAVHTKAVHTVEPSRTGDHLRRLASAGIDVVRLIERRRHRP